MVVRHVRVAGGPHPLVVPVVGGDERLVADLQRRLELPRVLDVLVQVGDPRHVQALGQFAVQARVEVRGRDLDRRVVPAVARLRLQRARPVVHAVLRGRVGGLVVHRARAVLDLARHAQFVVPRAVDVPVHLRVLRQRHVAVRPHVPVRRDGGPLEPAVVVHEVGMVEHPRPVDAVGDPLGDRDRGGRPAHGIGACRRREVGDNCAFRLDHGRKTQIDAHAAAIEGPVREDVVVAAERTGPDRGRAPGSEPAEGGVAEEQRAVLRHLLEPPVDLAADLVDRRVRGQAAGRAVDVPGRNPGRCQGVAQHAGQHQRRAAHQDQREDQHETARTTSIPLHRPSPPVPSDSVRCTRPKTGTTIRSLWLAVKPATVFRAVTLM